MAVQPKLIQKIEWIDLLVLDIIVSFTRRHGRPPTQRELFIPQTQEGMINDVLRLEDIDKIYALKLTSNTALEQIIKRLRAASLISEWGTYVPSEAGKDIVDNQLSPSNNTWPISVEVRGGKLQMKSAVFAPDWE